MDSLDSERTLHFTAPRETVTLTEGAVVGGYRVIRLLGRGAMGEVYEVEQIEMRKRYALKVLSPAFSRDSEFVSRFRLEAHGRLHAPQCGRGVFGGFSVATCRARRHA